MKRWSRSPMPQIVDAERQRIAQSRNGTKNWRRWGPYVSERQWGTVREDYSPFGTAWDYLTHDQARSRAYRWGEDGIAGFCDDRQLLCLAIALWNGRDPILKERLFGLTNEGPSAPQPNVHAQLFKPPGLDRLERSHSRSLEAGLARPIARRLCRRRFR